MTALREMNRHARRAEARKTRHTRIARNKINDNFDIQVDAKARQIVMIFANAKGRAVVEDLWPDVEWETDDVFAQGYPPDWLFTHVRVTALPPSFEERTPLAFASPDKIGFAVALALQQSAPPRRVAHWYGQGHEMAVGVYNRLPVGGQEMARSIFVEHVPNGTVIGAPQSVN